MIVFNDEFTHEIGGNKIKGRVFNIGDYENLQREFPDWDGENVQDLTNDRDNRLSALRVIVTLSLSGMNDGLEDKDIVRLLNFRNSEEINPLIQKILDIQEEEGVSTDTDEKQVKN